MVKPWQRSKLSKKVLFFVKNTFILLKVKKNIFSLFKPIFNLGTCQYHIKFFEGRFNQFLSLNIDELCHKSFVLSHIWKLRPWLDYLIWSKPGLSDLKIIQVKKSDVFKCKVNSKICYTLCYNWINHHIFIERK